MQGKKITLQVATMLMPTGTNKGAMYIYLSKKQVLNLIEVH